MTPNIFQVHFPGVRACGDRENPSRRERSHSLARAVDSMGRQDRL